MSHHDKSLDLSMQVGHPPDRLALVPCMHNELLQYRRSSPTFRRRPFLRRPVIDVPVWFVEELFIGVHRRTENKSKVSTPYTNFSHHTSDYMWWKETQTHLIILPQLPLLHPTQPLPRKRTQQQITLQRPPLPTLIDQPRAHGRY